MGGLRSRPSSGLKSVFFWNEKNKTRDGIGLGQLLESINAPEDLKNSRIGTSRSLRGDSPADLTDGIRKRRALSLQFGGSGTHRCAAPDV